MEGKNKSKQPLLAGTGKNTPDSRNAASPAEKVGFTKFPTCYLFFYWILFGQIVLLLLSFFGYESLQPVIDRVSSSIPAVESLRLSEKVLNKELARAHYALMWLCSPVLIIAVVFSPVRQGEKRELMGAQSRAKDIFFAFLCLLLGITFVYIPPDGGRGTFGLERFAIVFALLSSLASSFIALSFRGIKLILTDTTEEL